MVIFFLIQKAKTNDLTKVGRFAIIIESKLSNRLPMIVTIDLACFRVTSDFTPQVLLKRRVNEKEPAYGEFALVGGWIWEKPIESGGVYDKTADNAVERIIETRIGVKPTFIEQIPSVGNESRDSRGWSLTLPHYCLFNDSDTSKFDDSDDFKWVSVEEVLSGKEKLPFDHQKLVAKCWAAFTLKSSYSSVGMYILPDLFTFSDAIKVFANLGVKLSKQTISHRWERVGLIKGTGETRKIKAQRPAELFQLCEHTLTYFGVGLEYQDIYGAIPIANS